MKLLRLAFLGLLASVFWSVSAQDVITLKNGDEIKAKVTEMTSSEIKYKRFDNLDGPTVVVAKTEVFAINYENGTREVINTVAEDSKSTSSFNERAKPNIGIFVNPGAAATFGPMAGIEVSAGLFSVEAHVFFPQSGLMTTWIGSSNIEKAEGGFGIGIAPKFYTNRTNGGFYAGAFVDYWKTKFIFPNNFAYTDLTAVAFGTNVGYKFVFPFGLYLRTGGYIGASVSTKRDYYEINGYYEDWSGEVDFFGFFDLTLGFNFLKVER